MSKKILTIDDSKTVRTIISKHLSQFSVAILEAENGEQGVERAREGLPDLILLDYNMPVMDGYHTLVELRADPKLKSIPVIMVTTETSKETVVKLLKLGLNDYIAKPFTRELLLEKINTVMGLYDGERPPPEKSASGATAASAGGKSLQPSNTASKTSPAILAVDDKASILQLFQEYLGGQYEIVTAESGKAALEKLSQQNFEHIFLDLSMPDMSGFDVLEACVKAGKEAAIEKKVTGMTMRSVQADIGRASEAGIPLLYKPFTRADVKAALDHAAFQKKLRFLTTNGSICILDCPAEKSSKFRFFAASLGSEISEEVQKIVEEGFRLLIIKLGEGVLSHKLVRLDMAKLLKQVVELDMKVRLVADSVQTRRMIKQFLPEETESVPIDMSLDFALSSIA